MNLSLVECRIQELSKKKDHVIIGIDGRCASGKTTLAKALAEQYDASVIHMDDFFLRPEQRTSQRYDQPGGNVDYERFLQEVGEPLQQERQFVYRRFDCTQMALADQVSVALKDVIVVEGSYSMLPQLRHLYDIRIFMTVNEEEQLARIKVRNPDRVDAFRQKWIPYEEKYFRAYQVKDACDIVFDTSLKEEG